MTLPRRSLLAAAGLAATSTVWAQGTSPVRIGVLTDMSGPFSANTGTMSVLATRLAVEDFGGSVLGRLVEVISADHQNRPDVGAGIARQWFDRERVDVVADLVNSSVALAVMDVAQQRGKVALVAGSGSTAITNEGCTDTAVQLAYNSYATASAAAKPLIAVGKARWFFLTADYAFGQTTERDATAVIKAAGGTVLGSVRHPPNTTDFSSYLLQAQASGADVLALASAGADSVNAAKQAAEFGLTQKMALVSLGLVITDVNGIGLDVAQGMYLSEGFYWDRDAASRAFAARFTRPLGKVPNMVQAGLYSGVTHWLKAAAAAGGTGIEGVMAAMRENPVEDALTHGGTVRSDGLMVHDMLLLQAKTPSESKAPWDLLKVVKVVPGAEAFPPLGTSRCARLTVK